MLPGPHWPLLAHLPPVLFCSGCLVMQVMQSQDPDGSRVVAQQLLGPRDKPLLWVPRPPQGSWQWDAPVQRTRLAAWHAGTALRLCFAERACFLRAPI